MARRKIDYDNAPAILLEDLSAYALNRFNKAKNKALYSKKGQLYVYDYKITKVQDGVLFLFLCKCDCENIKYITFADFNNKKIVSCGCWNAEKQKLLSGEAAGNALYSSRRADAKRRFLQFTITREEYGEICVLNCYYCGAVPANEYGSNMYNGNYMYQGIDRIDNSKGYIKENCRPCCKFCNMAKSTQTEEEFLKRINCIYNFLIKGIE